MYITRKVEFSASHVCRLPELNDAENRDVFGDESNPNGHGHNYVLEVTVAGEPDPVTGMIVDLRQLKEVIEAEVIQPMDHRFLNYEVKPFDTVVPTAENIAQEIWKRLQCRVTKDGVSLARVRLFETPDLYVDVTANGVGL